MSAGRYECIGNVVEINFKRKAKAFEVFGFVLAPN